MRQIAFIGRYGHTDADTALRLPRTLREEYAIELGEIMREESEQARTANDID